MFCYFVIDGIPFLNYLPRGWLCGVWRKCDIFGSCRILPWGLKHEFVNCATLVTYMRKLGYKVQKPRYGIPNYTLKNETMHNYNKDQVFQLVGLALGLGTI